MLHERTCLLCFPTAFLAPTPTFCSALPFAFLLLKNLSMMKEEQLLFLGLNFQLWFFSVSLCFQMPALSSLSSVRCHWSRSFSPYLSLLAGSAHCFSHSQHNHSLLYLLVAPHSCVAGVEHLYLSLPGVELLPSALQLLFPPCLADDWAPPGGWAAPATTRQTQVASLYTR